MELTEKKMNYQGLVSQISETYLQGQKKAVVSVNSHLIETYWAVGQYIVEFEQKGNEKAEYGKSLLEICPKISVHYTAKVSV